MLNTANTQTELWFNLIREAEEKRLLTLTETQEGYLVFMLQRFMKRSEIFDTTLALEYLNSSDKPYHQREIALTDVADISLLFAGLFPDRSRKLNVSNRYFRDMGQMCFFDLAILCNRLKHKGEPMLYQDIARSIDVLISVLLCVRVTQKHNLKNTELVVAK